MLVTIGSESVLLGRWSNNLTLFAFYQLSFSSAASLNCFPFEYSLFIFLQRCGQSAIKSAKLDTVFPLFCFINKCFSRSLFAQTEGRGLFKWLTGNWNAGRQMLLINASLTCPSLHLKLISKHITRLMSS